MVGVQGGRVVLDGQDVRGVQLSQLRSAVSVVSQVRATRGVVDG